MSKKERIKAMVEGGAATPGPPLGPALGPLGVNAAKVVEAINKATESYRGMRVPVTVVVDAGTKQFEIEVGSPPTSALLIKAAGIEKGGGAKESVGDISFDQVMEVAKSKMGTLLAKDLKAAVKEVVGNCQSLRLTIQGLTPKELTETLNRGILDDYISGKAKTMPKLVHKEEKAVKLLGHIESEKKEKGAEAAPAAGAEGAAPAPGAEEKKAEAGEKKAEEKKPKEEKKK